MKWKPLAVITAGLTLLVSAVSHATPIHYHYTYKGAYPQELRGAGYILVSAQELLAHGAWTAGDGSTTTFDPASDTLSSLELTWTLKNRGVWEGLTLNVYIDSAEPLAWSYNAQAAMFLQADSDDFSRLQPDTGFNLRFASADPITLADFELTVTAHRTELTPQAQLEAHAVPSPSTLALLSLGLLGTVFLGRRREKKKYIS